MRSRVVLAACLLLAVAAVVGCGGSKPPIPQSDITLVQGTKQKLSLTSLSDVVVDTLYPGRIVYTSWNEQYSLAEVHMTELVEWVNVHAPTPISGARPFVLYWDGPADRESDQAGRYWVCHPVPDGTEGEGKVHVEDITKKTLVVVRSKLVSSNEVWQTVQYVVENWPPDVGEIGPPFQARVEDPPGSGEFKFKVGAVVPPLPFPPPDTVYRGADRQEHRFQLGSPELPRR